MGRNILTGGRGGDLFEFTTTDGTDTITDFQVIGTEKIVLTAIDANTQLVGDQAFTFIGANQFTNAAGQLRAVAHSDGYTVIQGDVNGDSHPDLTITLKGTYNLTADAFRLA